MKHENTVRITIVFKGKLGKERQLTVREKIPELKNDENANAF